MHWAHMPSVTTPQGSTGLARSLRGEGAPCLPCRGEGLLELWLRVVLTQNDQNQFNNQGRAPWAMWAKVKSWQDDPCPQDRHTPLKLTSPLGQVTSTTLLEHSGTLGRRPRPQGVTMPAVCIKACSVSPSSVSTFSGGPSGSC